MTDNLLALASNATPGPWRRPIPDVHAGRVVSAHAPACPPKATEVSELNRWHKTLAIFRTATLADAVVALHSNLTPLLDGSIAPANWDAVRIAVKLASMPQPGHADRLKLELTRVVHTHGMDGECLIAAPAEVDGQPLRRREIGEVRFADGEDAERNAAFIAELLARSTGLLTHSMGKVLATRQIGQTVVVIDADFAKEFDQHDWKDDGGTVTERKTGLSLPEMVMGADGLWTTARPQVGDGFLIPKGALDCRRHMLRVESRARPVEINIPVEISARLQAAAAEFGGDLGRAVAERFA